MLIPGSNALHHSLGTGMAIIKTWHMEKATQPEFYWQD